MTPEILTQSVCPSSLPQLQCYLKHIIAIEPQCAPCHVTKPCCLVCHAVRVDLGIRIRVKLNFVGFE